MLQICSLADMGAADKFYHLRKPIGPSVWAIGKSGISIYSTDGSSLIKRHDKNEICGGNDCSFREAISDGKHHVFASNALNSTIDVYSIDTGAFVASLDTCGSPWSIDYHPVRDEVWVHCWGPDAEVGDTGHVDVFSASSLDTPMSQVQLHPILVGHAHGSVEVDSSLGHFGYATDLNTPFVYRMNLNTKEVEEKIEIPNVSGLYRMAYSHVNRHLFLRSYVCCSCGFDGADIAECGRVRPRPVNVVTGPNQGTDLNGTCGHGCEGSPADTTGVFEFDTQSNEVVDTWQISDGLGADPYVSPYGDFIALFGNNGGSTVRLLKPGKNGAPSKLWADVNVGFNAAAEPSDEKSVSDSVFIQDSKHNIAVFTSTLSNSIALVDMSKTNPEVKKLKLTEAEEITSGHGKCKEDVKIEKNQFINSHSYFCHISHTGRGARRNIIWAVGTDYIWVDGENTEEFYIIKLSADGDVNKAMVEKTLKGIGVRRLLYVENYAEETVLQKIQDQIQIAENMAPADKTVDSVGMSGLIIGILALVLGIANAVASFSNRSSTQQDKEQGKDEFVEEAASLPSLP